MDPEKKKNLEETFERLINVGLCIVPYEDLSNIVAPEVMLFGTTIDEKVYSWEDLDEMFKSQYEQMGNMVPSLNRKRLHSRVSDDEKHASIIEEVTLTMASPEEVNSILIRCSCIMEYQDSFWKLTHWHASTPVDTENDHWHQEEWKREKEKLQKLVDQQTADLQGKNRELEIEASIERVRAVAMGMARPEDMLNVCRVISDQLQQFGVEHIRNVQTVIVNEEKGTYHNYQYFTPYDKESFEITECHKNPTVQAMIDRMLESPEAFFTGNLEGEELRTFREYRKQDNQFPDPLLEETESVNHHFFSIGRGGGGMTRYHPLNQYGLGIFKRFHNVFSLTYRRFRDIELAEAQAREAQIELSLERIRAHVTAMQESSDLLDIVVTMRTEFVNLGHEAHYFWHMQWLPDRYDKAMTSGDGTKIGMIMTLPRHIHGDIQPVAEWEKSDESTYVLAMDVDTAVDYVDKMISLGDFEQVDPQAPTLDDIRHIGGLTFIMARTTHGEIGYSLPGVVPDPPKDAVDTLVRFAGVFDLAYKRFEDLKAAERQHRKAKIELALERVRARSMAMHQSDELADLSLELVKQVHALGIDTWFCAFNIYDDHPEGSIEWGSNGQGTFPRYRTPREGVFLDYYEAGQRGETLLINEIGENECPAHYRYLCSLPGVGDQLLKMKDEGIPFPAYQIDHAAYFKYGYILFITFEPVPEAHDIFKRFANVFQQTYTRFLDLQKAEEQAREAQIEMALEKVRSRTMAMQSSDELTEAATEMFSQIEGLGLNHWSCGFNIFNHDKKVISQWVSTGDGRPIEPFDTPTEKGIFKRIVEHSEKDEPLYIEKMEGKKLEDTYKYMASLPTLDKIFEELDAAGIDLPKKQVDHAAYFKHGYLMFITYDEVPEFHSIFKRFAKVFEQTYTRFLDLKKAEAQAREAQINLAVERVRARALAMFGSEEILDVVNTLKKEIMGLEIPDVTSASIHLREPDCRYRVWDLTSVEDGDKGLDISLDVKYRMEDTPPDFYMREVWANEEDYFVIVQEGDRMDHAVDWLQKNGHEDYAKEFETFLRETSLERAYHPTVPLEKGRMSLDTLNEPTPEVKSVLKKMAGAFDLAYKRFEDLKKAEAQTREAQIEAALERARAQSMMMQHSDEISSISKAFHEQLILLDIPSEFSYVWLPDESDQTHQFWASWSEVEAGEKILQSKQVTYPLDRSEPYTAACFAAWADPDVILEEFIPPRDIAGFFDVWEELLSGANKLNAELFPEGIYYSEAYMRYGCFGINIRRKLTSEEKNILKRFSKEFERAYTRFLDLQKAENQALLIRKERDRLEIALNKLHATQDQLVQQEKLASLGQLTAGIAHEIKNPLNFVNNFSDLSVELIEEVREEVKRQNAKGKSEKDSPFELGADPSAYGELGDDPGDEHNLILDILNDIEANLRKIHEHGTRADGIVKSMLQHSRGGDGKMEPTDINALIKEYVNLAFHGMRAGSDPINVDIDLQLDEDVGEVPLVAEDFSRVILNLCNNAFDAMREKAKGKGQKSPFEGGSEQSEQGDDSMDDYQPKLTVRTKSSANAVTIEIQDNGPGIPDEIKDKILQPFFTTKKGTQGTGLGLSITNDIVKAHGGHMDVITQLGQTVFTIKLAS